MQKKWLWHFLLWLPYLILEVNTEFYWMQLQYQQPVWSTLLHAFSEEFLQLILLKVPMVYLMFYYIEKYRYQRKNNLKLFLMLSFILIFFSLAGYAFLMKFIVPVIYSHMKIVGLGGFGTLINSFMDKIFVAGVAIALNEYDNSQKLKKREQALLNEKIQSELGFLKSQINPHFLFNTLNNIYSLARKKSDETPQIVIKLSKLLRYVLYGTEMKFTEISKEIDFLNDYIDLQKIRFDERLKVDFYFNIDDDNAQILPLLMIPIVENAFKHGAAQSTKNSFIKIDLKVKSGMLQFKLNNSFEYADVETKKGIGLKNLKRQLELIYFDYSFIEEIKGDIFCTELNLDLNKTL